MPIFTGRKSPAPSHECDIGAGLVGSKCLHHASPSINGRATLDLASPGGHGDGEIGGLDLRGLISCAPDAPWTRVGPEDLARCGSPVVQAITELDIDSCSAWGHFLDLTTPCLQQAQPCPASCWENEVRAISFFHTFDYHPNETHCYSFA
jgi:hypothetical protein